MTYQGMALISPPPEYGPNQAASWHQLSEELTLTEILTSEGVSPSVLTAVCRGVDPLRRRLSAFSDQLSAFLFWADG
jgi:hypothetical protein